jgi:transposase-like protein
MERIQPSERIRKELNEMINGISGKDFIMSEFFNKAASLILQELLEKEVTEYLGRGHYERSHNEVKEDKKKVYRNGYEPLNIKTVEGKIEVEQPQLRNTIETYRSKLAAFFKGNTSVLDKLAVEMYARGLSTRDIEDALVDATGDMLLSRSSVSKVTDILYEEFELFQNRDLSIYQVEYLFLDGIYESLHKRFGMKQSVLCAWGITRDGEKVLLHIDLGLRESYDDWLNFLRDMINRGLPTPTSITSDGAPGLMKAIDAVFPKSIRIRCWFHRMENFSNKVPIEVWPQIKCELIHIRDAINYEEGKRLACEFIERHKNEYPMLIKAFKDDLTSLLNHLRLPAAHRRAVRTSNLIERSFEEERRRTKVIPGFMTEKSGLKLVFATLIRVSRRWHKVKFTIFDINYLDKLRQELNIDNKKHENTRAKEETL